MNRNAVTAGISAILLLGLVGCSAGSSGDDNRVFGRLDDVKHIKASKAVTKPSTRTVVDYERTCSMKPVVKSSGSGKTRRTWTETKQDCNRTRVGSHQVAYTKVVKPAKPARWCVELDNVNRDSNADDQWFTVDALVYNKWADRREGSKVKRMPYLRKGC